MKAQIQINRKGGKPLKAFRSNVIIGHTPRETTIYIAAYGKHMTDHPDLVEKHTCWEDYLNSIR